MQVRKVPIILSMLITLALLFGGWFFYQKTGVEAPIRQEISQLSAVKLEDIILNQDRLVVRLTVTNPKDFPQQYTQMMDMITAKVPKGQVQVELTNQDPALQPIWDEALFPLTEAIELRQYSKIPALLQSWQMEFDLDQAKSNIDQSNVYVFLKRGTAEYYAILPRLNQPIESEAIARG